jgi:hypothetical protein
MMVNDFIVLLAIKKKEAMAFVGDKLIFSEVVQ